jgi:transcriptional regulator with XRE-family HTH domain
MRRPLHSDTEGAVGALLRELRLAKGLSQAAAAKKVRRPQTYVSDLELALRSGKLVEVRELAAVYGVPFPAFARKLEQRVALAKRGVSPVATKAAPKRAAGKRKSKRR